MSKNRLYPGLVSLLASTITPASGDKHVFVWLFTESVTSVLNGLFAGVGS